jgi:hypothetical protein
LPAHGGRSAKLVRAVCEVAGRLLLPNPCGAWPESVTLPCAFQVRFEAREPLLLKDAGGREPLALMEFVLRELCCVLAVGGRFAESCDARAPFMF